MKYVISTMIIALVGTSTAMADMPAAENDEEWSFGLGGGMESQFTPYLGVDTQTKIVPAIMVDAGNISMRGPNLSYRLLDNQQFTFSALARMREEYLDSDESSELEGILDRDETIELGIGLDYKTQLGNVTFKFYNDAESNHDGFEAAIGWNKSYRLTNSWKVKPYTQINYRSDDLNNYYFGVSEAEATVNRLAYTAGSTTDVEIGVGAQYKIDRHQMLILDAKLSTLGSEIKDSPIVDASSSSGIKAIDVYRF